MNGRIRFLKTLFVFFIGIGIAAAQTPTPPGEAHQIQLQKAEAQRILRQNAIYLGWPTLTPLGPIIIMQPPLQKIENK